jgi:1-acyl-sn-glycerol-3-phosphate acyltransferase
VSKTVWREPRGQKVARRIKTVPLALVGLVVVTALLPVLLVGGFFVDLFRWLFHRKTWMAMRLALFLWVYLLIDTAGIVGLFGIWIASGFGRNRGRLVVWTWHFQQLWIGWFFCVIRVLLGLKVEVEGDDCLSPGPVIVFIRHASIVDNLLPSVFVAARKRVHLRYVLKRELLSEPCLDIAGQRLPNYFVRRDTGEEVERERVQALAEGMGPEDGFLLYPEGTRFTPERRQRALEKISERDPARARRLSGIEYLLPPKAGGVLAVLDGAPETDVVLMAHQGFDGMRLISDIWDGELAGRVIRVRFTRIPAAEIPAGRDERVEWLDNVWLEMDGWVGSKMESVAKEPRP